MAAQDAILTEDLLRLEKVVVTGTPVATSKKQFGNTIATVSGNELRTAVPTRINRAPTTQALRHPSICRATRRCRFSIRGPVSDETGPLVFGFGCGCGDD